MLRVSLDENLEMIADSVQFLADQGRELIYDAEHFFDGWKNNPDQRKKVHAWKENMTRIVKMSRIAKSANVWRNVKNL